MPKLPALFVSHGSPMLAIEDGAAHRFLKRYGADLPRPDAILAVSAHWETAVPMVSAAPEPETIHDFGGFAEELHRMTYPALGAPSLARDAIDRLAAAGFQASMHPSRGLDHGAWVPLSLLYPQADIPVTQLSIQPHEGPAHHFRIGQALAPLRERGVLILASGALTHNLRAFFGQRQDAATPTWVQEFADWIGNAVADNRVDDLLNYRDRAPFARENHPTDEHLLPLFVALGAGNRAVSPTRLHSSVTYGVLAMDAYAFN